MKINLRKFAKEVTLEEGGKVNLSIAQVLEVQKIIFTKLARLKEDEVKDILRRYK